MDLNFILYLSAKSFLRIQTEINPKMGPSYIDIERRRLRESRTEVAEKHFWPTPSINLSTLRTCYHWYLINTL